MNPDFKIFKIEEADGELSIWGVLDRTTQGEEKWVDEGWIGSLLQDKKVAFGRWYKIAELWRFRFDKGEKDKLTLCIGTHLEVLDGYWGERAALVYDDSIPWEPALFKPRENWDHDHCAILWETISQHENDEYYLGNKRYAVCKECYQKYILAKDISFIPIDAHN